MLNMHSPSLSELGINWNAILETTKEVVNPTRPVREEVLQSADLAGPLVFGLLLGVLLLFVRVHALSFSLPVRGK